MKARTNSCPILNYATVDLVRKQCTCQVRSLVDDFFRDPSSVVEKDFFLHFYDVISYMKWRSAQFTKSRYLFNTVDRGAALFFSDAPQLPFRVEVMFPPPRHPQQRQNAMITQHHRILPLLRREESQTSPEARPSTSARPQASICRKTFQPAAHPPTQRKDTKSPNHSLSGVSTPNIQGYAFNHARSSNITIRCDQEKSEG